MINFTSQQLTKFLQMFQMDLCTKHKVVTYLLRSFLLTILLFSGKSNAIVKGAVPSKLSMFTIDDPALKDLMIRNIFVDKFKQLWIGTDSGLYRYTNSNLVYLNNEFSSESARSFNGPITNIQELNSRYLAISYFPNGIVFFDRERDRYATFPFEKINIIENDLPAIKITKVADELWLWRFNTQLYLHNSATNKNKLLFKTTHKNKIVDISYESKESAFYIQTVNKLWYSENIFAELIPIQNTDPNIRDLNHGQLFFYNKLLHKLTTDQHQVFNGKHLISTTPFQYCLPLQKQRVDQLKKRIRVLDAPIILEKDNGLLAIVQECGGYSYNLSNKEVTPFLLPNIDKKERWLKGFSHSISAPNFIDTHDGSYILEPSMKLTKLNDKSLSSQGGAVFIVSKINNGQYIVSNATPGLKLITDRLSKFSNLNQTTLEKLTGSHSLRHVVKQDDNTLWLSSQVNGLFKVSKINGDWEVVNHFFPKTHVRNLFFDKTNLWVATEGNGLQIIDLRTNLSQTVKTPDNLHGILNIVSLNKHRLLVGTTSGILVVDKNKARVIKIIDKVKTPDGMQFIGNVWAMNQDNQGAIWVGSHASQWGLFKFDQDLSLLEQHSYPLELGKNSILSMTLDKYQQPVLATMGGGLLYRNHGEVKFSRLNTESGLLSDTIQSVIKTADNEYWLSTENGLAKVTLCQSDTCKTSIQSFSTDDGLSTNLFDLNSANLNSDNSLIYGGFYGLTWFNPKTDIVSNRVIPTMHYINYLNVDDKKILLPNGNRSNGTRIELPHSSDHITLKYGSDDYVQQDKKQYRYRVNKGNWQQIKEPIVTMSALTHGDYIIEVTSSNSDRLWSHETSILTLVILPPFWLSIFAIILYLFLFICTVYIVFRWKNNLIIKRNNWLEDSINKRTIELNTAIEEKEQIFENTSHELRTPLTLILGHIELALKEKLSGKSFQHLSVIQTQSNNLLDLVNNLLSLAEINAIKGERSIVNIVTILETIISCFQAKAEQKSIMLTLECKIDRNTFIELIPSSESNIFVNLLDNAIKYSPESSVVHISVNAVENDVLIIITDEGPGFRNINNVRKRFKREDKKQVGSGLGLSIAQQSVNLNNGTLTIQNLAACGCEVSVRLPMALPLVLESQSSLELMPPPITSKTKSIINKSNILIVEDNENLNDLFQSALAPQFNLTQFNNGACALAFLNKSDIALPELIISDVMMPKMDGYEFCHEIKSNEFLSHIPVILLTAKTDEHSRKKGLDSGADDYIGKPFNIENIKSKLINMIKTQQSRKANLLNYIVQKNDLVPEFSNTKEADFANKVKLQMGNNYNNPQYKINDLAKHCHMTDGTLNRHLNKTFNKPFTTLLLEFRMQKSYEMLKSEMKIQHIADKCGFSSSSYFTKLFKSEFNQTPREFRSSLRT